MSKRTYLSLSLIIVGLAIAGLLTFNLATKVDPADAKPKTNQLFFYDWEGNLYDRHCKTHPDQVNGGQKAIPGLYQAVLQASACPVFNGNNVTTTGPVYYAFDKRTKKPLADGTPQTNRKRLIDSLTPNQRTNALVIKVNQGVIVIRNQKVKNSKTSPDHWWVLRDNPELNGTEIRNPRQAVNEINQPVVAFEFTSVGKKAFARLTKRIAHRGSDNAPPPAQPAQTWSQHLAIRLGSSFLSIPIVNYLQNPDGLDGRHGTQISGGFTVQEAKSIVKILKTDLHR